MELSFPALEGLNSPGKYSGPLGILSFLDVSKNGFLTKYPCGHRAARCLVIRPSKVLFKALQRRGLLGCVGNFDDVVIFDLDRIKGRVLGHREMDLCPICFYSKLLSELAPTCPFCGKMIGDGSRVWLVRYSVLNQRQRSRIKSLKVKHDSISWAMCCCASVEGKDVHLKGFVWDERTRSLENA